jgi:hypothetical protein
MSKFYPFRKLIISSICLFLVHPLFAQTLHIFDKGKKPGGLLFSVILVAGLFIPLAVHELGHLAAGLIQGFRFELFVVGLLGIKRTQKGISIYLNKNVGMMGGIAATVPTTNSDTNKRKFGWVVLAGPITSLVFAIVCFALLPISNTTFQWFWLIAGACSFSLCLATTLPTKSGVFFTDRARFQRLISKGKAGESEEALLSIIAQTTIDNSSKNIALRHARTLQNDEEAFMRFWGYYYEYHFYLDNEIDDKAIEAKARLIEQKSSIPKQMWKALKITE